MDQDEWKIELSKLRRQNANRRCFDCGASNPTWASLGFGVYICLNCAGVHRSLGVHITLVRSTTLDSWNAQQIKRMKCGGNSNAAQFFRTHGISSQMDAKQKYNSNIAKLYKNHLDELCSLQDENQNVKQETESAESSDEDSQENIIDFEEDDQEPKNQVKNPFENPIQNKKPNNLLEDKNQSQNYNYQPHFKNFKSSKTTSSSRLTNKKKINKKKSNKKKKQQEKIDSFDSQKSWDFDFGNDKSQNYQQNHKNYQQNHKNYQQKIIHTQSQNPNLYKKQDNDNFDWDQVSDKVEKAFNAIKQGGKKFFNSLHGFANQVISSLKEDEKDDDDMFPFLNPNSKKSEENFHPKNSLNKQSQKDTKGLFDDLFDSSNSTQNEKIPSPKQTQKNQSFLDIQANSSRKNQSFLDIQANSSRKNGKSHTQKNFLDEFNFDFQNSNKDSNTKPSYNDNIYNSNYNFNDNLNQNENDNDNDNDNLNDNENENGWFVDF
ncbi:adp-ribosylation factor gtpase activating protein 3 isoform h [Anaeramoeba ignava]|uniref:Adp-ribosylation factor gtpase activating protein 3 isoform h n=1 Tax=Anaeramoeba ignava TaxID=1746090 RepID=A0A9Q0LLC9_ANAIG|nr:adp-ribosylation factor gtpase activating protein 3 isoform h [Anaeramoeba ignava]